MVNEWWLVAMAIGWLVSLVGYGRMCYRHGIWDGAFNHFLPIVKQEMLRYAPHRAKEIFEAEERCSLGERVDK